MPTLWTWLQLSAATKERYVLYVLWFSAKQAHAGLELCKVAYSTHLLLFWVGSNDSLLQNA